MEAKELRIGNWVNKLHHNPNDIHNPYFKECQIRSGYEIESPNSAPFCHTPIPLTGDWLVKFGFEKKQINTTHSGLVDYISPLSIKSDYGCTIDLDENQVWLRDCDGGKVGVQINNVHQLQNLYFALTGKELEIK